MSEMKSWAEKEVELAIKRELGSSASENDPCYNWAKCCYESALRTYKFLCDEGHSGASIQATKQILNRLIDGKCLTPIEDTDDIWRLCWENKDGTKVYQCSRMSSLFKDVMLDGTIKYHDNDRIICYEDDSDIGFYNNGLADIVNELYPIEIPYYAPSKPYKIFTKTDLINPEHGDFDTHAVLYLITPDGERVEINRFWHEDDNGVMQEISEEEYHSLFLTKN